MRLLRYILFLFCVAVAISCSPINGHEPEFVRREKTLLVYMAGNNNLSDYAEMNLRDIKKGVVPTENNLLVYYHTYKTNPLLLRIAEDETGAVVQDTVYRFPECNSADPASLTSALKVAGTMFPADEFGLILWSHGTGWLPVGHYSKSFGQEGKTEMDIKDMVKAFPFKLSYVVFDACLMGGIEVVYQMKDSVDYIVSSPTEVCSNGFPYSKIFNHIFSGKTDLVSLAQESFRYYNSMSGNARYATVSVVNTSALDEVAAATKTLFEKYRYDIPKLPVSNVQPYFRGNYHWYYDFGDFVTQLAGEEDAAPVIEALQKAVIYKAATAYFYELKIDPAKYSGLSTYIPLRPVDVELDAYYKELEWNKAVEMIK